MTKASKKRAKVDPARSSTGVTSTADEGQGGGNARTSARSTQRAKGISGVPGSLHDERRCTATANRTGERCRAAAIKGGNVCRMHGGSLPGVKKSARERLLSMTEPAMVALEKVLNDAATDDNTKVRAALGILDRTGFRPGVDISVRAETEWDKGIREATVVRDIDGGGEQAELEQRAYDALQLARDESEDAWREAGYDAEDAPPDHPYADERTVRGEVVSHDDSLFPDPNPTPQGGSEYDRSPYRSAPRRRAPDDPPRYVDTEAREAGASGD